MIGDNDNLKLPYAQIPAKTTSSMQEMKSKSSCCIVCCTDVRRSSLNLLFVFFYLNKFYCNLVLSLPNKENEVS